MAGLASVALLALATACDTPAEGRTPPPRDAVAEALARSNDPAVRAAEMAMAEGRPYYATRLLEPALADSARRTPEVVLLAARAASRWDGWGTVQQLLADAPWLDQRFDGAGRELLARAALDRDENEVATAQAARAAALATTDSARGVRTALLARALDRRDVADSAAAAYARAATLLPGAADWLRLRAAGVEGDSGRRARLYAALTDSLARRRVPLVDAQALERAGDSVRAAGAYAAAGAPAAALRLRAATATGNAERNAVRAELLQLVASSSGSATARAAADVLTEQFAPLTGREALLVGRSLARSGPTATAADAFARAGRLNRLTADDRLLYARVLFRLGRYDRAAEQFGSVPTAHPSSGDAAYERARALLRAGHGSAARTSLRSIEARHGTDADAVGQALYLLADLATDEGRDAAARRTFRYLAAQYPGSNRAPSARFQAAIIAFADHEWHAAAAEMDTLARRYAGASDATGARYWAARAWQRAGDTARARAAWQSLLADEPLSYYAVLAARRLDTTTYTPPAGSPDAVPLPPDLGALFERVDLLQTLGLDAEAERERDRLASLADGSTPRLLATAEAFHARGRSTSGIALARRALARGAAPTARLYRDIYPVVHGDVLAAEARERQLDPALVAALIRQESSFLATARSPVGARGLMQLMPDVGRAVARAQRFPRWDDALLYQPDVNIRLGTAHLAGLMERYDALPHVLAAYNAGESRVTRWRRKGGAADDPELFTERIPYAETRDYVRIVERNRALYEKLYSW